MDQKAIGAVHFSPARGVKVRDEDRNPQDAVYGTIAVYVSRKTHTDALISNWDRVMTAAANAVEEILSEVSDG